MTNNLNDFIKTANERVSELGKELKDRTEDIRKELKDRTGDLRKEVSEQGEKLGKDVKTNYESLLTETLTTVSTLERGVLRGVERVLNQAAEAVVDSNRLERAHKFIKGLAEEADRLATKVEVEVARSTEPFAGYDEMNVRQVLKACKDLNETGVAKVIAYEQAHKARKGVLEPLGA